jgi:hypothetical protein
MALGTTLKVGFDATSVQSGFSKLRSGAAGLAGGIAKVGAGLVAIGVAGAVALAGLAIKMNSIGEAGISSEKALENVVKQMGLFGAESKVVSKRLIELANTTARQTGLDRKSITATQTKLATFKELAATADETGGAFDRATMAALDMAAAGFGTAEGNAVQLGKALNDPIKGIMSLTKSGITFTAEERNKIKTLVESNKMLEAQTMVLAAIEKQVGGTANATADSSKRIKTSMSQIVEAFAMPFSQGFDNLPAEFEAQFEKLKKIAGQAGDFIGAAIRESIQGNHEKFELIGEIIGTAIKVGIKNALEGVGISSIKSITNLGANAAKTIGLDKAVDSIAGEGMFNAAQKQINKDLTAASENNAAGNTNAAMAPLLRRLNEQNNQVQAEKIAAEIRKKTVEESKARISEIQNNPFSSQDADREIKQLLEKIAENTKESTETGAKM